DAADQGASRRLSIQRRAMKHRITNAFAEGTNSVIQLIKSSARGFRNFENYRTAILFFCGGLDLFPQESR
ncbi:MAG TPA: transposase, partial [Candidatus Mcinerneyibacteriales bacterium]|nr:transposase [Candidatus Mcinerneyibacteriales bacterium]